MDVGSYDFFSLPARSVRRGILFIEDYSAGNDGERIAIVYSSNPRGDCRVAGVLFVGAK